MNRKQILFEVLLKQSSHSRELGTKFFFHWALLATGIFSLLIPFIQGLKRVIYPDLFIVISILLVISIVFSSITNFITAKVLWYIFEKNNGDDTNQKLLDFLSKNNKYIQFISIFSFVMAIIFILFFVNSNLLK